MLNRHLAVPRWTVAIAVKRPKVFLILSFGLSHRLDSPRVAVAVEPYPNRWTHHVIVWRVEELDRELMGWLAEAHEFALAK